MSSADLSAYLLGLYTIHPAIKMRDYRSIESTKKGQAESKTIDIPSCPARQTRRKRRSRPAAERFHGKLLLNGSCTHFLPLASMMSSDYSIY